jgi:hypothetical protein
VRQTQSLEGRYVRGLPLAAGGDHQHHALCLWIAQSRAQGKEVVMPAKNSELYSSPNGDRWLLVRQALSNRVMVRHEPNLPSGGKVSVIEVGEFLSRGHGPEQQALLKLIGSLVEVEADAITDIE